MNKLLNAGFMRLRKSKIFLVLSGFMFAFGLYMSIGAYLDMKKYHYVHTLDNVFFNHIMLIGIVIAVFCSLFTGTEYSDGTIRNKLIVGHSRLSIYISNLILCIIAGIALSLCYMAACACAGIPLLGFFQMDLKMAAQLILCSIVISIAYTSIFTLAAMLIHSKASLATVSIITAFFLMLTASYLFSALSQPEMITDYTLNASGEITQSEPVPNEFYPNGTKRKVYEFLMEFLPSGQGILLLNGEPSYGRIMIFDCFILVSCTGIGLLAFQKKDIK